MALFRIYIILLLLLSSWNSTISAAEYNVIILAHHGIEQSVKQWQASIDVLNNQIPEHTFTLVPMLLLNEILETAAQGAFDFILTNPSSFVEIAEKHGAIALVTLNNKRADTAQTRLGSVIFTHTRNEDILKISDLKGKTLMVANEQAFGGWRVAWLEMLEQGFEPYSKLKKLVFADSRIQPEVVFAVRDGIVNAGVVRTDRLERMEAAGKIDMRYIRVINIKEVKDFPFFLSTKLYPEWPFAASKKIPEQLRKKVATVLLNISKNSQAAKMGKYIGWSPPQDYDSVKKLMKRLKVGAYVN